MIVEYEEKYNEDIKRLLVELQEYIVAVDKEKYNIIKDGFKEDAFNKTLDEVKKYEGKIFLGVIDNQVVGLVVGVINNEEIDAYDFKVPKRGRITELIITKECRSQGMGTKLLKKMEDYLKNVGCKSILLGVFAYNVNALNFYEKHGYHKRKIDMIKE